MPLASICVRLLPSCGRARATTKKASVRKSSARRILPTRAALFFPIACRLAVDEKVSAAAGPLFGLVHSAGIAYNRPLKVVSYKNLLDMQRVNVDAGILLAKGFRQLGVCEQGGSSIVLIASVAALKGEPALAGYSATKGALISLTRTLGVELAPQKIRVNCISPALVMTQMADGVRNTLPPENMEQLEKKHPLGLGTTDDVAYTIACLLAPGARWITGANIVLDGGYTA